jgi:GAF domain-containing protein
MRGIFEASLSSKDKREFFHKVVEIGGRTLDAKCCSIFLLDPEHHWLRLMDASGTMGKKIKQVERGYYVPEREPLTKAKRRINEIKIKSCIQQYRQAAQLATQDRATAKEFVKQAKNLVEDVLPMGITAYVCREGKGVMGHGVAVRRHPEWLGNYEDVRREICTSLIALPLRLRDVGSDTDTVVGVIKIENHKRSPSVRSFKSLEKQKTRDQVPVFGPRHRQVLAIVADCVAVAMQRFDREDSYKNIFGSEFPRQVLHILPNRFSGAKNQAVGERLQTFYRDVLKWDIMGLDDCYERVIEETGELSRSLGLGEEPVQTYRRLERFDALLRSVDVTYREHFLHQFQVFVLGYCLINRSRPLRLLLRDALEKRGLIRADINDVITCWFVIAIFHDMAISIERMHAWLGDYLSLLFPPRHGAPPPAVPDGVIGEMRLTIPWGNLFAVHDGVFDYHKVRIGHSLSGHLQEELGRHGKEAINPHLTIAKIVNESTVKHQDHGFYGALILMHMMSGQLNDALASEAALAVSMHCPHVYTRIKKELGHRISVAGFPFAFLLVFCDSAQQWGRPRFVELFGNSRIHLTQITASVDGAVVVHLKYPILTPEMVARMNEPWENWEQEIAIPPRKKIELRVTYTHD